MQPQLAAGQLAEPRIRAAGRFGLGGLVFAGDVLRTPRTVQKLNKRLSGNFAASPAQGGSGAHTYVLLRKIAAFAAPTYG